MATKKAAAAGIEILTPEEMARADQATIAGGAHSGIELMERAGLAIVRALEARYPACTDFDVLCGPGNNGGDGYVVASILSGSGHDVRVFAEGRPREGSDGAIAAARCSLPVHKIEQFTPVGGRLVVDALYGAGLVRPLSEAARRAAAATLEAGSPVVSVDLPSGLSGESGRALGGMSFMADLTVTFARRKPGHLIAEGPRLCGEVIVADIGIPDSIIAGLDIRCVENRPPLWQAMLPVPGRDTHKYSRGHALVLSGDETHSGAARLSAIAAARGGAGAVTLGSPASALAVNAAHLTSIMLARTDDPHEAASIVASRKVRSAVIGPAFGVGERCRNFVLELLRNGPDALVLDADAITSFADRPSELFEAIRAGNRDVVLTPHGGEFRRIFPDKPDGDESKIGTTRRAAAEAGAVIIHKGADTVIAAPDGWSAVNVNGTPVLATAGSGDVLAGIVAGLLAQGMPAWEAACAAVWIHAEAARRFGPGVIAEDLPGQIPAVLAGLL